MRTLFARPDMAEAVQSLKLSTRRYYLRPIEREELNTTENIELMHYYLESRTIDDQIKALSIAHDTTQISAETNVMVPNHPHDMTSLSATKSLLQARSIPSEQQPTTFMSTLKKRFKSQGMTPLPEPRSSSGPSTGLPVSHDAEEIARKVLSSDWRAVLTYFIYHLPQLHTITIEEDQYLPQSDSSSENFQAIVQRALNSESITIPNLQKLIIIYTRRSHTSKLDTYWQLLSHPSLRSFSVRKVQEYGWSPRVRGLTLPLTYLSFSQSNLSSSSIDAFMKCCPHLTYLYYEHTQSWEEQPFNAESFGESIRHLKGVLRKLVLLRPEPQYYLLSVRPNEFNVLDSVLQDFKVLENLEITAHLLLGPQESAKSRWYSASKRAVCQRSSLDATLPRSLKRLTLRDVAADCSTQVRALVREKQYLVKHLETVELRLLASMDAERAITVGAKITMKDIEDEITWDCKGILNGVEIKESWLTARSLDSTSYQPPIGL